MEPLSGRAPRDQNRVPVTFGVSSVDGVTALPIEIDPATGELLTTASGGGGGGGTSSTFGATFPTTGTAVGASDGTDMQPLKVDGSDNLLTKINVALPAGTNLIGKVGIDQTTPGTTNNISVSAKDDSSGSQALVTTHNVNSNTESLNVFVQNASAGSLLGRVNVYDSTDTNALAVDSSGSLLVKQATAANLNATVVGTGTFVAQVTGTVTANAGTNLNTSALALESGGNLATLAGAVTSSIVQSNVARINNVTPLMGNGITGTGSQRVTIASDNTAFSVNATLSAETTKVIGVTRTADGSGNLITSTGNALDINIKSGFGTSIAVTNAGTFAVQDTVLDAAIISQEATTSGVKGLTAFGAVTTNAPTYTTAKSDALSLDTSGLLRVSLKDTPANTNKLLVTADAVTIAASQTIAVTNTGTFAVQATLSAETTKVIGTVNQGTSPWVTDDLAGAPTGASVPANAMYQGNAAATALPAAATPGNLTGQMSDKFGRPVVLNNAVRDIMGTQTTTITASVSETTIITQAASIFNDLAAVFIANTSATGVSVAIRDATAGTVIFTLFVPAGDMRGITLTTPWPQTTVNTNWTATSSGSVTSLVISALFVKNK